MEITQIVTLVMVLLLVIGFFLLIRADREHRHGVLESNDLSDRRAREEELRQATLQSARAKITDLVDNHLETLARRRLGLVRVDHYGVVEASGWNKEVQHFVDKIIRPNLSQAEAAAIAAKGLSAVAQELIEDRVAARADQIENSLQPTKIDDPIQFERWCANILGKHGWHTTATKSSGDQGADVIAEKAGRRVVLQCKLYSNPVGNKAVQEAFSAERHYRAHASAVVSNAEFTPSARDLARSTGVLLLTPSDLDRLDALVPRDRA